MKMDPVLPVKEENPDTNQICDVFVVIRYVVNKRVLENCGIDSEQYSGFAFGMGLERIAMLKYGINNIKLLFNSDLRVLEQINEK